MADQMAIETHGASSLRDPFGRAITYVRVSVTDRCDFRCAYCMAEDMTFLPRRELLTLEELDRLCSAFIEMGTRKIRITGGEPLVRRDIMGLFRSLSRHLEAGALQEITLTTNGSQLARFANDLASCGVRRVNVSLDTLNAARFKAITRRGDLARVLTSIDTAQRAGLAVKINVVALKGVNEDEFEPMVRWAHARNMGITFIEVMPLGDIEASRFDQHLPLTKVRAQLAQHFSLQETDHRTGGPARYVRARETGGLIGFITPLTHNFCETCNRVRVTCTGTLYMCLGHEDAADLRTPLRASEGNDLLIAAIREAIARKPKGHDFIIDRTTHRPAVARHMSGGVVRLGGHQEGYVRPDYPGSRPAPYVDQLLFDGKGGVHHIWACDHYKTTLNADKFKQNYKKRTDLVKDAMSAVPYGDQKAMVAAILAAIGRGGLFAVDVDIVPTKIGQACHVWLPARGGGRDESHLDERRAAAAPDRALHGPARRQHARLPHRGAPGQQPRARIPRNGQAVGRRQVQGLRLEDRGRRLHGRLSRQRQGRRIRDL